MAVGNGGAGSAVAGSLGLVVWFTLLSVLVQESPLADCTRLHRCSNILRCLGVLVTVVTRTRWRG